MGKLWEQSKALDKGIIKEYDLQITPKKEGGKTPGVINDSPGAQYECGDMDKWKKLFQEGRKTALKKLKPVLKSLKEWISAFQGNKVCVTVCSGGAFKDILLFAVVP